METRETELGVLPAEWTVATIGELFAIQQGASLSPKRRKGDSPRPFLRTANVFWDHLDLSVVDSMDFTDAEVERLALRPQDLLVCEGGDIGRTAMWHGEIENCCYQNHLHRLRAKDSNVESAFYMYWMQAALTLLDLYKGEGNKTTIPNLSQSRLKSFVVPLPPLLEQRAIARLLSNIQRAIETQDNLIVAARELKKSLMRQLFTQGLDPNSAVKEIEIGVMPEDWELQELGAIADIVYGAQAAVANLKDKNVGTPILTNINITNDGDLDLTTLRYYPIPANKRDRLVLKKGDLLFNWRSGSQEHVGKTALFNLDGEYTFASFILRFRVNEKMLNTFLHFYLQYLKAQKFFAQKRDQSSVNSVFNASMAQKIPVTMPPLSEQREIARILATVDKKIETEEKRQAALQTLFKTTLQQLMTGQIRATNTI